MPHFRVQHVEKETNVVQLQGEGSQKRRNDKGAAAAAGGSDGITVQRLLPGGRQMPDVLENRAIDSGSSRSRAITLEH